MPGKGSWTQRAPRAPEGVTGLAAALPLAFLIFFLFKEERYFQRLITKLELRLNCSPGTQQQQSLVTLAHFYNGSDGAALPLGLGLGVSEVPGECRAVLEAWRAMPFSALLNSGVLSLLRNEKT